VEDEEILLDNELLIEELRELEDELLDEEILLDELLDEEILLDIKLLEELTDNELELIMTRIEDCELLLDEWLLEVELLLEIELLFELLILLTGVVLLTVALLTIEEATELFA
jgi:hypothetical protein